MIIKNRDLYEGGLECFQQLASKIGELDKAIIAGGEMVINSRDIKIRCEYCGTSLKDKERCSSCGAPK